MVLLTLKKLDSLGSESNLVSKNLSSLLLSLWDPSHLCRVPSLIKQRHESEEQALSHKITQPPKIVQLAVV